MVVASTVPVLLVCSNYRYQLTFHKLYIVELLGWTAKYVGARNPRSLVGNSPHTSASILLSDFRWQISKFIHGYIGYIKLAFVIFSTITLFYTEGHSSSELSKLFMPANSVCIKETKATEMHDKDSRTLLSHACGALL